MLFLGPDTLRRAHEGPEHAVLRIVRKELAQRRRQLVDDADNFLRRRLRADLEFPGDVHRTHHHGGHNEQAQYDGKAVHDHRGRDLLHAEGIADKRRDHHDLHVGRDHHQEKRSKAQQSHAHNEIQRIDARHAYSPTLPRLTTCTPSVPFRSTRRPLPTDFPLAYSVTGASASPPNAKV